MKKFLLALFLGLSLISCTAPQREVALETGAFVVIVGGTSLIGPGIAAGAAGITYLFLEATDGKTVEEIKQDIDDHKEAVNSSLSDRFINWITKWIKYLALGIGALLAFKYREKIKSIIITPKTKKLVRRAKSRLNKIAGKIKKKSRK